MLNSSQQKRFNAVIMAGGGGTRLWPWSRKEKPKQMLTIVGDRSMFQTTVDRLDSLISYENIYVVTTAEQAKQLELQVPEIADKNYLIEPLPKGTAPVIGIAAVNLLAKDKDAVMAVLTADHYIRDIEYFRELLSEAFGYAEKGHLVTLGIEPTFPSTGMGYIEFGEELESASSQKAHKVARFTEKPDLETAKKFLATGKYYWNSGMFIWRADRILEEIKRHIPDLYAKLMPIADAIGTDEYDHVVAEIWPTIKPVTIDYGVMEKAEDVVSLPAKGLGWNDVGSWESIYEVREADENGNIYINCKSHNIDSEGVLTCSDHSEKMIITVGMKDIVVVETDKAVLVCPRNDTQRVKEIVQYLKDNDLTGYL